jgi:hypothetical protein
LLSSRSVARSERRWVLRAKRGACSSGPHEFGRLVKVLQGWSSPASIDRAVRSALEALGAGHETNRKSCAPWSC